MKWIPLIILSLLLFSCSKVNIKLKNRSNELTEGKMKNLLLKTRNVYSVDKNLDTNNPIEVVFHRDFEDQLIEINLETTKINSSQITIFNSFESVRFVSKTVNLGTMKVLLDGVDITSCIIAECSSTFCGGSGSLTSLTGDFNTYKMYLNLTKMDHFTEGECTSVVLGSDASNHVLRLEEIGGTGKGARVNAQVIVYNRTYKPENILNIFPATKKGGKI